MQLYKTTVRPTLFRFDPEMAHHFSIEACHLFGCIPLVPRVVESLLTFRAPELSCEVAGLRFANPVGLAAGWDKSGRALCMLNHLGFGFVEIGSISARPSLGNPKPRLFRIVDEQAIVVNYGLPNDGAARVARRLAKHRAMIPLGINLVKTNDGADAPECDAESIMADYYQSASLVHQYASYLTLNLSCPNAPGGKDFFSACGAVSSLLKYLSPIGITCPVFLKIAPDPDPANLERIIEEALPWEFVRGFIFNLPTGKPPTLRFATARDDWQSMPGAVAGKPVEELINRCIRELYLRIPRDRFVIIGAGGVTCAEDAYRKICLGAALVQIYSAMIFEGPGIVRNINSGLCKLLQSDGFQNITQAIGTHAQR